MKTILISIIFGIFLPNYFINAQTNANNWTWIKGANTTDQPGYYGVQGVAGIPNTPGARFSGVNWEYNGKLYLFSGEGIDGTGDFGDIGDIWEYDPASNNWRWLKGSPTNWAAGNWGARGVTTPTNEPGYYRESCAWAVGNLLYFFGGVKTSIVFQNALWVYDVNTNNWTWLKGASEAESKLPNYGILGTASSTNMPGGRNWSTSFTLNGKLYLFGGLGNYEDSGINYGPLNDLWEYNPATNNWTWIKGSKLRNTLGIYGTKNVYAAGNNPGGRLGATGWVANNHLYLFGGTGYSELGGASELNDLWEFDPVSNNWRWLKGSKVADQLGVYNDPNLSLNTPGARKNSRGIEYLGNLYLFGGYKYDNGNEGSFNDLWIYRPNTNNWTYLKGNTTTNANGNYGTLGVTSSGSKPGARSLAFMWLANRKLFLFGGVVRNDLWTYIPSCSGSSDFYSTKNGNWNDPTVWSCGRVPENTASIGIKGHTITVNGNFGIRGIEFTGGNLVFPNMSTLTYYPIVP